MNRVIQDASAEEFIKLSGELLYQDEPTNSLMLGLCEKLLRTREPPEIPCILLRVVNSDTTLTAAIQTPPMNLVITYAQEDQLGTLALYLKENNIFFPGVVGPAKESEVFTKIWSELSCKRSKLGMEQKIYKIETVIIPETRGILRLAEKDEVDLMTQWVVEFGDESLPLSERKTFEERKPHIEKIIEEKLVYVWISEGRLVSMAHVARPTRNGISISAVYTPPPLRKKGYASAIVAHLSQKMLDTGKQFCVLYTDTSNLTSNKIYQNVGYREVSDSKYFLFEDSR